MPITYKDHSQYSRVYLDKKHVGDIMTTIGGKWFYQPKSENKAMRGEEMNTRLAVKRSIEAV